MQCKLLPWRFTVHRRSLFHILLHDLTIFPCKNFSQVSPKLSIYD